MSRKGKLLIVEDDTETRRLYAIGLNRYGFEVKLAANGAEALDRVEAEDPDLLLLDLMMPVMNGWEVLERINPSGKPVRVPVVIITGQPPEIQAQHQHASIAAWLDKPTTIERIANAVSEILDNRPSTPQDHDH